MRFIKSCTRKALVLVLLAVLTACSATDEPSISGPVPAPKPTEAAETVLTGGTLRLPMNSDPYTLHPLYVREAQTREIFSMIFEPLITLGESREPEPCVAQSWTYENLVWTLSLRENIHWHGDTGDLSGEDAAFTVNTILSDPQSIYYNDLSEFVTSAEGYGSTLVLHVKSATYLTLYALDIPVIPRAYYADKPAVTKAAPRGSGPFAVSGLTLEGGARMDLVAFQRWWKKLPAIASVSVMGYASTDDMLRAFENGELDCLPTQKRTTEPYEILSGVNSVSYLSHRYNFLAFNMDRAVPALPFLRQAVAYALDRTRIISNIYLNKAGAAEQPVYTDSSLSSSTVERYDINAVRARALLTENGAVDSDGDGVLEHAGVPLKLEMLVIENKSDPVRRETADAIADNLREIGLGVTVTAAESDEYDRRLKEHAYDVVLAGCYLSDTPDLTFLFSPASEGNLSGYQSEAVTACLKRIREEAELARLKKNSFELQRLLSEDLPQIGLFFEMNTFLYRDDLRPVVPLRETNVYARVAEWYFVAQ